jgi:hypothetical protein
MWHGESGHAAFGALMRRGKSFRDRAAVALAASALAVQAALPLLVALQLHVDPHDPSAMAAPAAATASANLAVADAANPHPPGHGCTCPICEILAVSQFFALVSQPILTLPYQAPGTQIALRSAPLFPVSFPSSYQARAPPVAAS